MIPKDIIRENTSLYDVFKVRAVASTHVATKAKTLFVLSNSITLPLITSIILMNAQ